MVANFVLTSPLSLLDVLVIRDKRPHIPQSPRADLSKTAQCMQLAKLFHMRETVCIPRIRLAAKNFKYVLVIINNERMKIGLNLSFWTI